MKDKKIGFALCGSFCTLRSVLPQIKKFVNSGADVYPIMSEIVYNTDTRFGTAEYFKTELERITAKKIIHSIYEAEPIGPKKMFDILIIAPCTGNTLGKMANGITDTSVTMAAKANLRNNKPVLIAPSTNDALATSAQNIGKLLNYKNIYFVPFNQDAPFNKNRSCVADFNLIYDSAKEALKGNQIQPIIYAKN